LDWNYVENVFFELGRESLDFERRGLAPAGFGCNSFVFNSLTVDHNASFGRRLVLFGMQSANPMNGFRCVNGGSLYGLQGKENELTPSHLKESSMPTETELCPKVWFALQVRTRWERSTASILSEKGYETLLPTYDLKKHWGDRVKVVSAPLFPGYVFCRFDVSNRLPILITPGVISVVSRGRTPSPVDPAEMTAIQTMISAGVPAEPWPYLEVGQRVRIEDYSLHGIEGILIAHKGNQRIVVSVSLLRRSVALEIDRARVTPIGSSAEATPLAAMRYGHVGKAIA
jgi:transcription antitermination factor NusG